MTDSEKFSDKLVNKLKTEIAQPEWLDSGLEHMIRICTLIRNGKVPKVVQGWMIVVTCLRLLRAVFGDDLTTAIRIREWVLESEQSMQEAELEYSRSITVNTHDVALAAGYCIRKSGHDGPCNGFPRNDCFIGHPERKGYAK